MISRIGMEKILLQPSVRRWIGYAVALVCIMSVYDTFVGKIRERAGMELWYGCVWMHMQHTDSSTVKSERICYGYVCRGVSGHRLSKVQERKEKDNKKSGVGKEREMSERGNGGGVRKLCCAIIR